MSTNRLGLAEDLDRYWSETLLEKHDTKIEIAEINRDSVHALPDVSNYPYEGQLEITGEFTYYIPGRKREPIPKSGKYIHRAGSGLFMLDAETDRPKPEKVFQAINSQVASHAQIEDRISVNRQNLWRFLEKADSIEELRVRGPNGEYDIGVLLELVDSDDPEKSIEDLMGIKDIEYPENVYAALQEVEDPEGVETISDLVVDLYKISIVSAKASFWYDERVASITYRHGSLSIDAETEDAREYVLQLLERDVLPPKNY